MYTRLYSPKKISLFLFFLSVPWRVIRSSTLTSTAVTACSPAFAPHGRSSWRISASGGFCSSCSSSPSSHWPLLTTSAESCLLVRISWNSCVRIIILSDNELTEVQDLTWLNRWIILRKWTVCFLNSCHVNDVIMHFNVCVNSQNCLDAFYCCHVISCTSWSEHFKPNASCRILTKIGN